MANIDFYGPYLKIERAEHHIGQLETVFRHYISENMKRLRPERKHRRLQSGRTFSPSTFPRHTPTVLGDGIHNLRASLDHAYCILVEANGGAITNNTKFPFGKDRQSLEGSINGHKKEGIAPSDAVCDAIVTKIQPYEGGQLNVYGLHRLDITDKHHILLPTAAEMRIDRLDFVDRAGNKTGGGIQGMSLVVDQDKPGVEFFSFGNTDKLAMLSVPDGGGAILQDDPEETFVICFQKGQPFEGQHILQTMNNLLMNVRNALKILLEAA